MFGKKVLLFVASFIIVSLGQPAYLSWLASWAATLGYAIFFKFLLYFPEKKGRFLWGFLWFFLMQMVNLSWMTAHPYLYIYIVLLLVAALLGVQFALWSLLMTRRNVSRITGVLAMTALWVLLEWTRLFIFSGYSWNQAGISLAANLYSLQTAALFGMFGLSFLVMLNNLLAIRAWERGLSLGAVTLFLVVAAMPYLFGFFHLRHHRGKMAKGEFGKISVLLAQTAFPVEEALSFTGQKDFLEFVKGEWEEIFALLSDHREKRANLIVLPEFVVPFGTYTFVYPYEEMVERIARNFGESSWERIPAPRLPLAYETDGELMVNNAFLAQAIANIFDGSVVIGLEDAEDVGKERRYYSAALYFEPESKRKESFFKPNRYAKRVLVPMGEYIPFKFCRNLAASYGICGSFTCGDRGIVWYCDGIPLTVSICYEETFGNLMRDNCSLGAKIMVNITSDVWFPHSSLIRQHLEHARLRTVENGRPLIRACNTGITCAIDALGADYALLGDNDREREDIRGALFVNVPTYTYNTLYSRFGDLPLLVSSLVLTLLILI